MRFRRQAAIGPYIVDFVCFSHRLIIELDGPQHFDARAIEYDRRRDQWLAECGYRVIRFRNQALDECVWQVVDEIKRALLATDHAVGSSPSFGRERQEAKTPRDER